MKNTLALALVIFLIGMIYGTIKSLASAPDAPTCPLYAPEITVTTWTDGTDIFAEQCIGHTIGAGAAFYEYSTDAYLFTVGGNVIPGTPGCLRYQFSPDRNGEWSIMYGFTDPAGIHVCAIEPGPINRWLSFLPAIPNGVTP